MRPLRGSLAARALALQLAGVLAIVGGVGAARYYAIRAELHREVERSAESLAQVLEDLLAVHPELLQRRALDPLVDRFARKLPAVARVSVVDATGAILVDSRHAEAPPTDQEALLPPLSLAELGAGLPRRTLVRPLDQLAAAGAQFTRGEVPAPLTFSGRDELAGVARTFNETVAARTAAMKERERQLADAEAEVRVLRGILPICAQCKRIHTEEGSWQQIESYVRDHSHAEFSHGLCPDCAKATWG